MFADDLKAYHTSHIGSNFNVPLQSFVEKLTRYCNINSLKIAGEKCSVLHIGPKNPCYNYTIENSNIPNIEKGKPVRDLRIYFKNDLKWNTHIDIIVKNARRTSFALLRSLKSNDPQFLVNMFKTYVLPILEFASPVFCPYYAKDIDLMEKVQRDFLRMVYRRLPRHLKPPNSDNIPPYADLLTTFKLDRLDLRRLKSCLSLFHAYLHGQLPLDTHAFKIMTNRYNENKPKIYIPPTTKDARFNSFFVRFAAIYKDLDPELKCANPVEFSSLLRTNDFSKYIKESV